NGKIIAMAEPFSATYLISQFPISSSEEKTFYSKHGDYLGIIFALLAFLILFFGSVFSLITHAKNKTSASLIPQKL
ncbi:MAG: hypothetical protein ACRC5H_04975, partial [Treponemataceae bacterium]